MASVGGYAIIRGIGNLVAEGRYIYRRSQVHKGAMFIREVNADNPYKETVRYVAEVLSRSSGYVLIMDRGDKFSITMREFLRLYRVWYNETDI